MSVIIVRANGTLTFRGKEYRCAIGRGGLKLDKREGDGATPIGTFPLRTLFYRADKMTTPKTVLATQALHVSDGWCDGDGCADYNTFVSLPHEGSHERLWRDDDLYDLVVPLGYNDAPPVQGKGSAIFVHVARPTYSPTAGCVALAKNDLLELLALIDVETILRVEE